MPLTNSTTCCLTGLCIFWQRLRDRKFWFQASIAATPTGGKALREIAPTEKCKERTVFLRLLSTFRRLLHPCSCSSRLDPVLPLDPDEQRLESAADSARLFFSLINSAAQVMTSKTCDDGGVTNQQGGLRPSCSHKPAHRRGLRPYDRLSLDRGSSETRQPPWETKQPSSGSFSSPL